MQDKDKGRERRARRSGDADQDTPAARLKYNWIKNSPLRIDAMSVAAKVIFAAGSSEGSDPKLLAYAIEDGAPLSELPLPAAPQFDGMAIAQSRLYLALNDGFVLCLEPTTSRR